MRLGHFQHDGHEYIVVSYALRRPASFARLTQAELETVEGLLEGLSQREIARKRDVAQRTIANQLASAYRKLGLKNRNQLLLLARGPSLPVSA